MPEAQIGAQMFTVREFCKTPADIAKSCKRLADIGFRAVQPSALGPIEPGELKKILDDHGLKCVATHRKIDELRDTSRLVEEHQALGCGLTALGSFRGETRAQWQTFIREFNGIARTLGEQGLRLGYHNHSHEFAPFGEDPAKYDPANMPFELMREETDPSAWFELDTYWVAHGGADPAAWIRKIADTAPASSGGAGRLPAVHVKDMTITSAREHKMCEVGSGNLNWPAILDACRSAGVRWYLIERDRGDLDPFESLKISYNRLREWGLE